MGVGIKIIKLEVLGGNVVHTSSEAPVQINAWAERIPWGGPTDVDYFVKWSGDLGHNPTIDHYGVSQQYLFTHFKPGTHKVTASDSVGSKSVTVKVVRSRSSSTTPCNLTGITQTAAPLFIGKPREFTAEGTGLAEVRWRAPGGTPPTGTGPTFTTKWLKVGKKTVTATCEGTTKTVTVRVLEVSIQVNNTPSTKDDVVQLKSHHPPYRRFKVPCTITLRGPAANPLRIVLTQNPDRRLGFVGPGGTIDVIKTLMLPKNGVRKFEITGEKASSTLGDATIQARLTIPVGPVVAEKNVTVFSFDQAEISVKQEDDYELASGRFGPKGIAVRFEAKARLRPEGLDCTAPQIKNLRVGIMQEVSASQVRLEFGSPRFVRKGHVHVDAETVRTAKTVLYDIELEAPPPVCDVVNKRAAPLYSNSRPALKPPTGCHRAGSATSSDDPKRIISPHQKLLYQGGRQVGRMEWQINYVTWNVFFRTFCVVIDVIEAARNKRTKKFCALRQTTWNLQIDSRKNNQHADVKDHDDLATADPSTPPPFAIDAEQTRITEGPPFLFIDIP
jgi:hypothetical protein